MEILKYLTLGLIIIASLIIFFLGIRAKKAFRYIFINAILGISVFFGIYFTKKYTGISLNLNPYTASGSAILGIPGVIGFLFLNLMF